jgi:hypothetical protein
VPVEMAVSINCANRAHRKEIDAIVPIPKPSSLPLDIDGEVQFSIPMRTPVVLPILIDPRLELLLEGLQVVRDALSIRNFVRTSKGELVCGWRLDEKGMANQTYASTPSKDPRW